MSIPSFKTPATRWAALTNRDPASANAFIYSVLSTKIYCRPTCPSRLARRANVIFHDSAAAAEKDGFRACKRCRPNLREDVDPQKVLIERACELIRAEGKGGERLGVKALASEVELTESHFCRVFKKVVGMTVRQYRASMLERGAGKWGLESAVALSSPDQVIVDATSEIQSRKDSDVPGTWTSPMDLSLPDHGYDLSGTSRIYDALELFPGITPPELDSTSTETQLHEPSFSCDLWTSGLLDDELRLFDFQTQIPNNFLGIDDHNFESLFI